MFITFHCLKMKTVPTSVISAMFCSTELDEAGMMLPKMSNAFAKMSLNCSTKNSVLMFPTVEKWRNITKVIFILKNLSKLVQICSNLFKLVQTCLNFSKLDQTCPNLSKLVQTCPNLSKLDQTCPNLSKLFKLVQTYAIVTRSCTRKCNVGQKNTSHV